MKRKSKKMLKLTMTLTNPIVPDPILLYMVNVSI